MIGLEKSRGCETNLHVSLQLSCLLVLLWAVLCRLFSAFCIINNYLQHEDLFNPENSCLPRTT